MALIAMAVHDTEENGRTKYTKRTLDSLINTVDLDYHRIIIVDNDSCDETKKLLIKHYSLGIEIITNSENVGTAKAINQAWSLRGPGETVIKIDNDCVINHFGWVEDMEIAMLKGGYGIMGLKRKDLLQSPTAEDIWKTTLKMIPHEKGEPWYIVEESEDIMGTCTMFHPTLTDKMGGLMQSGLYGFDDTLACIRAKLLGYKLAFLPHIDIDHIDEGGDAYTEWKRKYAGDRMKEFYEIKQGLINGSIPIKVEL